MSQLETEAPANELIERLQATRDNARLKLHLLSLEAKDRWRVLEHTLETLEAGLMRGDSEFLRRGASSAQELVRAVEDLFESAIGAPALSRKVATFMHPDPKTCSATDSLNCAAQIMWESDCGAVPVVDGDGTLVGIVTDRDLCMAAYLRGQSLGGIDIGSVMSRELATVGPNDTLAQVVHAMGQHQIHRVPVAERGRLVGIVSLADVARVVRAHGGNALPGSVALAHAVADISRARESPKAAPAPVASRAN